MRESRDFRFVGRVRYMFGARAVTGLAAFHFWIVRRGQMGNARMDGMAPMAGFKFVAAGADACPDILGMALSGVEFRLQGGR